jgi:polyhydroxyalkanoate synthesis regulator phasin
MPAAATPEAGDAVTVSEIAALRSNVDRLESEVADLRQAVARIAKELGL